MTDTSSEQAVHIRKGVPGDLDWPTTLARLDKVLRIRTTPIGMKMFETAVEMEAVPKIRRPKDIHTADQIVSMASRLNWTVGITGADLVGAQCQAVLGLGAQDDEWYSGKHMAGVWFETIEDSAAHQAAMHVVPIGQYEAMAVSPLSTGRLDPPDICMIYATPGQMILLINGLQWSGYKKLEWGCVGESSCADSWGRALSTGEPSLSIPCYAERRYGGVQDDEMLMALQPHQLVQAIDGMEALSRNGLRYPIPPYGIQTDARAGLGASY
ncbi:DUF169 domain-containing protein [Ilumatobacter sp.]|jgi:uncharacterized protein (DUF169 family)|uniref:DUF169 domain-containing protein n=1 Tax=Ilumatobacter sp. TaxID=1967498 RepID=UPI00309BD0A5|tara:strand:+ start:39 stop:845 length:807 start_codon:yes stop_codon:yes gene_type:complete